MAEVLESRAFLSGNTYTPTVFTDDNNSNDSLRDAIIAANADPGTATDTIVLGSGTYTLTIPNTGGAHENLAATGDLNINTTNHELIIEGQGDSGPNATIIKQTVLDRVFQLVNTSNSNNVTFQNLEITGGTAVDNGTAGATPFSTSYILGGGIQDARFSASAALALTNVAVVGNQAGISGETSSVVANSFGGGIEASSTVIATSCLIENNEAFGTNSNGPSVAGTAAGGGIYADVQDGTINSSLIEYNNAIGGNDTSAMGSQSGGDADGGGIAWSGICTNDIISGNEALGGTSEFQNGGAAQGGGARGGNVLNCTISYNVAQGGAASTTSGNIGGIADGGGAFLFPVSQSLTGDAFYGNQAISGSGPTSGQSTGGGALVIGDVVLAIANDTFYDNSAIARNGNIATGSAEGGGLWVSAYPGTSFQITNVTIVGDTAQGGTAPGGPSQEGATLGGGLEAFLVDTISNSLIAGNTEIGNGSGSGGPDVAGSFPSTDHNLGGVYAASSVGFSAAHGDQLGSAGSPINPLVGPLANNGGPAATLALLAGSPAIDAGDNAQITSANGFSSPPTDQRGDARIAGGTVDIGAFEANSTALIQGHFLFYSGSQRYDLPGGSNGQTPLPFSDDNAIATDKSAYLPGSGATTFANVSSYTLGINGLMLDIGGTLQALTPSDFIFKTGNNNSPSTWTTVAATPTVTTRGGAGVSGSDRVEITFPDNAIQKTWLEVIVKGNDALGGNDINTGLAASDVFFWGSAVGDDGTTPDDSGAYRTATADELDARNNSKTLIQNIPITNAQDYNRDGQVSTIDQLASRNNPTTNISGPHILNIAGGGPLSPDAVSAGDSSASPTASPTATPTVSSSSGHAALASGLSLLGSLPPTLPSALQSRLQNVLDSPPMVGLLRVLEQRDSPVSCQILQTIDQIADKYDLHDDALDGILVDLGLG